MAILNFECKLDWGNNAAMGRSGNIATMFFCKAINCVNTYAYIDGIKLISKITILLFKILFPTVIAN